MSVKNSIFVVPFFTAELIEVAVLHQSTCSLLLCYSVLLKPSHVMQILQYYPQPRPFYARFSFPFKPSFCLTFSHFPSPVLIWPPTSLIFLPFFIFKTTTLFSNQSYSYSICLCSVCVCICQCTTSRQSLCGGQGCRAKTGKTGWVKNREVKETNMALEGEWFPRIQSVDKVEGVWGISWNANTIFYSFFSLSCSLSSLSLSHRADSTEDS